MHTFGETNSTLAAAACRLCLLAVPKECMEPNIFKSNGTCAIANKIASVTRLQLYEGDGLPTTVCQQCIFKLTMADEFINMSIQSNQFLKSQVGPITPASSSSMRSQRESSDNEITDSSFLASWEKAIQTPPSEEFLMALEFVKSTHETEPSETDYIGSPVCEVPKNIASYVCEADVDQCGLFDLANNADFYENLEVDNISLTMEEFRDLSISLDAVDPIVDYCSTPAGSENALNIHFDSALLPVEKLLEPWLNESFDVNTTGPSEPSISGVDNISITRKQFLDVSFCENSTFTGDTHQGNLDSAAPTVENLLEPSFDESTNVNTKTESSISGEDNFFLTKELLLNACFCDSATCAHNTHIVNLDSAPLLVKKLSGFTLETIMTPGSSEQSNSSIIDEIKKKTANDLLDPLLLRNVEVKLEPLLMTDRLYKQAVKKLKARQASKLLPSVIQIPNPADQGLCNGTPHISLDKKGNQPKLAMDKSKSPLAAQTTTSEKFVCEKCFSTLSSKGWLAMHKESRICARRQLKLMEGAHCHSKIEWQKKLKHKGSRIYARQQLQLMKAAHSHSKIEWQKKLNVTNGTPEHELEFDSKVHVETRNSLERVTNRVSKLIIPLSFKCCYCSCTYMYKQNLKRHMAKKHPGSNVSFLTTENKILMKDESKQQLTMFEKQGSV